MKIELTIDRFEEEVAVLKTNDDIIINWPKDKLPENIQEGSILYLSISIDKQKEVNNKNLAKDILNEILDPE